MDIFLKLHISRAPNVLNVCEPDEQNFIQWSPHVIYACLLGLPNILEDIKEFCQMYKPMCKEMW